MSMLDERANALDRFVTPLYTVSEAARYLDVPASTLTTWTHGYHRRPVGRREVLGAPVLTALPRTGTRDPVIPFIGLAEGLVLTAMRRSGVPLQRIRPALERLEEQFGLAHALASKRLYTDGAEVLFDYAQTTDDPTAARAARELVVVRNDQRVFNEIVAAYLRRLEFDTDGYARLIHLPAYEVAEVVVDPARGFGQPIFAFGGARLEDALALFRAGEPLDVVAEEYGVPPNSSRTPYVSPPAPPPEWHRGTREGCPNSSWTAASAADRSRTRSWLSTSSISITTVHTARWGRPHRCGLCQNRARARPSGLCDMRSWAV